MATKKEGTVYWISPSGYIWIDCERKICFRANGTPYNIKDTFIKLQPYRLRNKASVNYTVGQTCVIQSEELHDRLVVQIKRGIGHGYYWARVIRADKKYEQFLADHKQLLIIHEKEIKTVQLSRANNS